MNGKTTRRVIINDCGDLWVACTTNREAKTLNEITDVLVTEIRSTKKEVLYSCDACMVTFEKGRLREEEVNYCPNCGREIRDKYVGRKVVL